LRQISANYPYQIWEHVLREYPHTELTEKQVYAYWQQLNTARWWLKDDQVESACAILQRVDGIKIDIISIPTETGIDAIAFAFKDILEGYGEEIIEVAMDSTCQFRTSSLLHIVTHQLGKTNAKGYELYTIVGEANGQALLLAFVFTALISSDVQPGAKDHMLRHVIKHVHTHCPNIAFTLSDKDLLEINAFHEQIHDAKHQLCYWHAIKYLEERLAEDKPPAKYDPRTAHQVFPFIDPTWAPGITVDASEMQKPGTVMCNGGNVSTSTCCAVNCISQCFKGPINNMPPTSVHSQKWQRLDPHMAQPTNNQGQRPPSILSQRTPA
jgi:hypothetical protein